MKGRYLGQSRGKTLAQYFALLIIQFISMTIFHLLNMTIIKPSTGIPEQLLHINKFVWKSYHVLKEVLCFLLRFLILRNYKA